MIPLNKTKIGRNDLCPCGSQQKYKRCHGGIQTAPAPVAGKLDAQMRKLKERPKCLAPDSIRHKCSKSVIDSHTVSRSGSLGAIVRDGHVYSYALSLQQLEQTEGQMLPKLVGWKSASTFPGFCGVHDKQLFAPLEDEVFAGSPQQCFLLGYRAVVRELYTKRNSANQNKFRVALATATGDRDTQLAIDALNQGVELGLRDALAHKEHYDRVLSARDWGACHGLLVEFKGLFPIQCATGLFPERDVAGAVIQVLGVSAPPPSAITLSSFAADGKSYVLLCWLTDSDEHGRRLADSVAACSHADLPGILAALLLQSSENCHFSPDWYDALPEEGKNWVQMQAFHGVLPFFAAPPPVDAGGGKFVQGIQVAKVSRF